jgi:group I intron endonuclease
MANVNKYSRGKIYRLVNDIDDDFYVGSTCESLSKRKAKHKGDAKRRVDSKMYKYLNQVGWGNVHIVLIEQHPCNNVEELRARERYWIDELKPSLNKAIPLRTIEEHKQQKKEYGSQRVKCECGGEVRRDGMSNHKKTQMHQEWLQRPLSTI